jgi:cellulose synthase/poly-beta-1,6-N-acetylglucosamine synthase-like glycosyltransferase
MLTEILNLFFFFSALIIGAYLIRHYIFTLTVLRSAKNKPVNAASCKIVYEPSVSILIPAHNEDKVVGRLLQKMTELSYPKDKLEIILIDDASTDNTGKIAEEYSNQHKLIKVLHRDKQTGGKGKASALNAALKQATGEIVLCFDADYLPHSDIIAKIVEKFSDPNVGAVQGRPVVLNEPSNIVTRLITLERIGGYRVDQEARDILGLIPQFGGTVGGFRRSIVSGFGGFDESMLTEDTDLTFQIYLAGYKIRYAGDAECYEEAVDTWKAYWRQRHRWAKGHMQVCFKHEYQVLTSKKLKWKEKIDGLLLLHIYFMPIITFLSFLAGGSLILFGSPVAGALWFVVLVSFYSFVGNYAPFFEIGIGAHLDGRKRVQWLAPLMIFSFLYNVFICTKAFFDLIVGKLLGRSHSDWEKTEHLGNGNCYIEN